VAVLGLAACLAPGAPARADLGDLVDKARDRMGAVLLARDVLAEPDKEVALEASLRTGLRFGGIEGKRLQFLLGDQTVAELRTNSSGDVAARWTPPPKPGNHVLTVRVHPQDQPAQPVADTALFVAARAADTPLVIVDLDKTVVQSGFAWVLLGQAKPMTGASVVLQRLAKDHTIVYLTHRPDFLGATSKNWLTEHSFPPGPVLTSTLGSFLSGSGTYKTGRLEAIRKAFKNIVVGIGDKLSDAKAYADTGLPSILILQVDWSGDDPKDYEKLADGLAALPDSVQVVTNWSQIASILFNQTASPKKEMEQRLRAVAGDLRRRGKD